MLRRAHEAPGRRPAQVLVLFAFGGVALVSMVGLAIDLGNIYVHRRVAQTAADTAALAAARALTVAPLSSTSVTPPRTDYGQEAVRYGCMYGRTNAFGDWTTLQTLEYVGKDGKPGGAGNELTTQTDVLSSTAPVPCPAPAVGTGTPPAGGTCTLPPMTSCGSTFGSATVNSVPDDAAGVHAQTKQTFDTYILGIVGIGSLTVVADSTAVVGQITSFSSNSPFIACAVDMKLDDSPNNNTVTSSAWSTYFSGSIKIVSGSGPYTLNTTPWKSYSPGCSGSSCAVVASSDSAGLHRGSNFDPTELAGNGNANGSGRPYGPAFVLHGNSVKNTCGASNNWKGLSCAADSQNNCPGGTNTMNLTLPPSSPPPYTAVATGTSGNSVGNASNTVGPWGCGPGIVVQCIDIVPLAVSSNGSFNLNAVLWAEFWVDDCNAGTGNNVSCGWYLGPGTAIPNGTTSNTWTFGNYYSGTTSAGPVVIKLNS